MTFEEWWEENEFEWVSRKDMAKAAWGSSQLNLRELLTQALPNLKSLSYDYPRDESLPVLVDQVEEALK